MDTGESAASSNYTDRLIMVGLVAVCLLIYGQVLWFAFINFDDNLYVFENPFVTSGINAASLNWAFTTFHSANWHPLTWMSHMLDASLFGPNAGGHHFVNVIFHAANSILAFVVFKQFTGDVWKSAVLAFLFAVHPAHVESVAWVSERKDVLSTLFWLLTMLFYFRYATSGAAERGFLKRFLSPYFLLTFVLLGVGLLAKPMLVTLPFVLLLLDLWPLKRIQNLKSIILLAAEKIPLIALAAASSVITFTAQKASGSVLGLEKFPIEGRILNSAVA